MPFYPFLSFSCGLLVCPPRAGAESLWPWRCTGHWVGRLTATNNCFTNQECLHFEMCWQIQLPPLDIHTIRSALCSSARLRHQVSSDETIQLTGRRLHFSVQNTTLHPVLDEEKRRVYMDNLLSLMDKLHICIARSFHRGVVSCTLHKTVISAAERLMVSNEILLQCVTMGTSVSLHSLHTLQLSTLPVSIFTRPKPKLRSLNGLTKMLLLSTANARNGYLTENHKSCDTFKQTCKVLWICRYAAACQQNS